MTIGRIQELGRVVLAMTIMTLTATLGAAPALGDDDGIAALTYYTEEYRPLNYTGEDGRLTGLSVELLRLIWAQMGVEEQPILVRPWARSYRETLTMDDKVLFATSRTDEREDLFKWVCAISPNRQVVFGLAGASPSFDTPEAWSGLDIGTVRDDVSEQLLLKLDVDPAKVHAVSDIDQNIKKLRAGRLDLIAYGESAAVGAIRQMGLPVDAFDVKFVMRDTANCYAFSRRTDDAVIARFQQALDAIVASPAYTELLGRFDLGRFESR